VNVSPETYKVTGINKTFTINITVSEVTDLWGWEISLFYNSTQLNCTNVQEGPFLKATGNQTLFWIVNLTDNFNATHGYIRVFCAYQAVTNVTAPSGDGIIANVTFRSKTIGTSILELSNTKLKQLDGEYLPHEDHDGTITIELGRKLGDLGSGIPPQFFLFDGKVDGKDLALFLQCYHGTAPPEAMYLGDLGSGIPPQFFLFDGKVDGKDLALFLQCYRGQGPN
jgi:hypothetical protein